MLFVTTITCHNTMKFKWNTPEVIAIVFIFLSQNQSYSIEINVDKFILLHPTYTSQHKLHSKQQTTFVDLQVRSSQLLVFAFVKLLVKYVSIIIISQNMHFELQYNSVQCLCNQRCQIIEQNTNEQTYNDPNFYIGNVGLRGSSILIYEVLGIAKLCWKPALQDHTLSLMSSDPDLIILGDV